MELIFHMARDAEWAVAKASGTYRGAAEDRTDGFIHFSTASQIRESAAKHRAGESDLILIACDVKAFGHALKWEQARGVESFPHLYGEISMTAVVWAARLTVDETGRHVFPDSI